MTSCVCVPAARYERLAELDLVLLEVGCAVAS